MNKFAVGELVACYAQNTGKYLYDGTVVCTPEPNPHYYRGRRVRAGLYLVYTGQGYAQGPERCLRKIDGDAKKVVSWDTCVFKPKTIKKWVPPKLEGVKL